MLSGTTHLKHQGSISSSTPALAPGGTGKASTGSFGWWWCLFHFGFGNRHYKYDLRSFKSTTEYKEKNFLTLPLPSCTPRRQPKLLISRVSFRNLSLSPIHKW